MKERLIKVFTQNLILKLISIVAAVILWVIVVNVDDPTKEVTISGITVNVLNDNLITDNDQVYEIVSGQTVTIKVSGPRSIVEAFDASDFIATADFSELSQTNAVPIKVVLSSANSAYTSKVSITSQTYTMRIDIEDIISKTYTIGTVLNGTVADGYYLDDVKLSDTSVTITAAESVIDTIATVSAVIDVTNLDEDLSTTVSLTGYSSSGNSVSLTKNDIELSISSVDVTAKIYKTATLPIVYETTGAPASGASVSEVSISTESLSVYGSSDVLDALEKITIPSELLDIDGITSTTKFDIDVSDILPDGVYLADDEVTTLTVTVTIENTVTKVFSVSVKIGEIPDGYSAKINGSNSVSVTLSGTAAVISELTSSDIIAYVDLTDATVGTSNVLVSFTLPDGVEAVDEIYVSVTLNADETTAGETTEEDNN